MNAVGICFQDWLNERGDSGTAAETLMAAAQVKEYLERYANKHFDNWRRGAPGIGAVVEGRVQERWGYRCAQKGQVEFFVIPTGLKRLCEGLIPRG